MAAAALAGVNQWTPLGPYDDGGAPVVCVSLAVSPDGSTVVAGADAAVYRSEDGGQHWTRFQVPTSGGVLKLIFSSSLLYAGTGSGIFISADRGETWMAAGLSGRSVHSLALDPRSPDTLYAGAFLVTDMSVDSSIFKTQDGGATWDQVHSGVGEPVTCLAIDPFDSATVYAASQPYILRSQDSGSTWMTVYQDVSVVRSFAFDSAKPGRVFASWGGGASPGFFPPIGGVLRSDDQGNTWETVPQLPRQSVGPLVMDPSPPSTLYAEAGTALWRSVDGGESWAGIAPSLDSLALAVAPGSPSTLFAAGYQGVWSRSLSPPGPCTPDATSLCLQQSRFRVHVDWQRTPLGFSQPAAAVPVTSDAGYFWFFDPDNVELMVKVLDGTFVNGHFWVFYGALSNVQYRITVTDTVTGQIQTYDNARGELASHADTTTFPGTNATGSTESVRAPATTALLAAPALATEPCTPDAHTLCLNEGRFRVETSWQTSPSGPTFSAPAVPLTGDTGYFWFFEEANVELVVKVIDGREVNGHFWVFYGALSSVGYTVTVTDIETGKVQTYTNTPGALASVADTAAF